MKTNGNLLLVKVQLAFVIMVAAASLLVISPAAASEGIRKSRLLQEVQVVAGSRSGPIRTNTCTRNVTICLDLNLSPAGPTCCASKCVNTRTDLYNCGGCSRPCQEYWTCCDGVCVYTLKDSFNCGACGHVCPVNARGKRAKCSFGICGYN